jgi:type VI secretion system protein VasG
MIAQDLKALIARLNNHLAMSLETAAGFCLSRTHYEVTHNHLFLKLLEEGSGDIPLILKHFNIDGTHIWDQLNKELESYKTGNTGRQVFSPRLIKLFKSTWVISSVYLKQSLIRSGAFILAFLEDEVLEVSVLGSTLSEIDGNILRKEFFDIVADSSENQISEKGTPDRITDYDSRPEGQTALDLYTVDFTERAAKGEMDPVFARENEIRQMIDILCRRRKNNPILVGEAGVGKTAVVEGLALKIAAKEVPESLKGVSIRALDLGLLQAGAGVKGEFENRIKSIIKLVTDAMGHIILFIDEAHTLIGAGGSAGVGDAANLLKPALARGHLRTIGATTWSEFKKYIEKDPALERRFQMVKINEPDEESAEIMLRGLKKRYEHHHNLSITEDAIKAAVAYSKRYIPGRQLPDKAVDLVDTSAARVKMSLEGKPGRLEILESKRDYLSELIANLMQDKNSGYKIDGRELEDSDKELDILDKQIKEVIEKWDNEKKIVQQIDDLNQIITGTESDDEVNSGSDVGEKLNNIKMLRSDLREIQGDDPLVFSSVDSSIVGSVISDWTGIPIGRMVKDEASALLEYESLAGKQIIGQDHALSSVGNSLRVTKSGVGNQDNPIGVFLFTGPSGVGKTETARITAEVLFGGDQFMTTINMSEYQEKHTVSQLKGSPPGYVGYGEGGILTEAVRRRPYSVVLLDEVEKAHIDVLNLFYQVFDKGIMRDGEGREIDFKNCIIMMTSNLGADEMIDACQEKNDIGPEELRKLIHPFLINHFKAALLARIRIIPFYPLNQEALKDIALLKLDALAKRLQKIHKIQLEYEENVAECIAKQCDSTDTGARNIDFILERNLLPKISRSLIQRLSDDDLPKGIKLSLNDNGDIDFELL